MADSPQAMAELRRLLAVREPLYAEAHLTVDTSGLGLEEVVDAVEDLVTGERERRGARAGRSSR
jgi:hypothetical protein